LKCIHCQNDAGITYRINHNGDLFCSDECYETYMNTIDTFNDHGHPYIDQYESIRRAYLDWFTNWQTDLEEAYPDHPLLLADKMNDQIDEIMNQYVDFYWTKGDDGPFAHEIYQYLKKFEQLQKEILNWRPERHTYYYLSIHNDFDEWEHFSLHLKEINAVKLYFLLNENVHPYDILAFYFETESHLHAVLDELKAVFGEEFVQESVYYSPAYICEGECHDYEDIENVNMNELNGWFYCCSCEMYLPGYFTREELLAELTNATTDDSYLERKRKSLYYEFYIRKVKRSCRYHNVEFPDWVNIELDY